MNIYEMTRHPFSRFVIVPLLVIALFVPAYHQVQASPVVQAIIVVVATGLVGLAITCALQIIDLCKSTSVGSGTPGGGSGGPGGPIGVPKRGPGSNPSGGPGNNTNGGGPNACASKTANTCGMHGNGTIVKGVCNATTPPDSACPTPVVGTFSADPTLLKKGEPTTLSWSVTSATLCAITGGGLSLANLGITGTQTSGPIEQKSVFTLTCKNGVNGPAISQDATVNIIPVLKEI